MDPTLPAALAACALVASAHLALVSSRRRKARAREAALQESHALAEALFKNSPRGIHTYELDAGDRLVFSGYNESADRILGIDHSSLVGKTIEEAFPPLVATEVPARYREAAVEGRTWHSEQVDYEDGAVKGAFEVMAFGTRPRAMAVVFTDITERKRAEVELERQRAFTSAVLESLPGIFYLYDYPGLRLKSWNKNHETALGFSGEEVRDRDLRDWHVPEAREAVAAAVDRCMREGGAKIEAPLVARDGRRIPYLLTGTRFVSEGREYLMGVGIDITERVAAEERLRILNQELEERVAERTRLLSESNAALEDALRDLKASQRKMLLAEKMATLGQLVVGLAHELNTPLGAIASAAETSAAAVAGLPGVLALHRSLDEAGAEAFAALAGDLSFRPERDRASDRRARRRNLALLESAGIADPSLAAERLSDLGYEGGEEELLAACRLPRFTEILSAAHLLESVARSDYVVREASAQAARVVRTLKTYSRRDEDEEPAPSDLREQLDSVLLLLENRLKRGVEVERDYGEVPAVTCRRDRLCQVWMNLITNALQAMEYRGRLELSTRLVGDRVEVGVTDDGPGIPEGIRGRVFEPFFTTKVAGDGLGLGLDICRTILDEMGASISFESRPGRTRFAVSLRIKAEGGA